MDKEEVASDRSFCAEDQELLTRVLGLAHSVATHHDFHGLSQIVLHDLSGPHSFGFKRAVYLADNPDFDHLQGVAGYSAEEHESIEVDPWAKPDDFLSKISSSHYYTDILSVLRESIRKMKSGGITKEHVDKLAHDVGIEHPEHIEWNLKHGNHGLLIYETRAPLTASRKKILGSAVALLGMCCMPF